MRRLLLLLVVFGTVVACALSTPPRFPHLKHLSGIECGGPGQPKCLTCMSCHGGVRETNQEPPIRTGICKDCHKSGEPVASPAARARQHGALGTAIVFSHGDHLALKEIGGQCVPCHAGLVGEGSQPSPFPPMSKCLECHQEEFDRGECTGCHRQGDLSKLLPQTFLRHDADWIRQHGMRAATAQKLCNQCHSESQCNDCHDVSQGMRIEARQPEAIDRNFVHRGDFITRHPIEANNQAATCLRCHSPSSCDSCHIERGVSGARLDARNPHPPGWVGTNTQSRDFHGRAARRDLIRCVACHDQGPATNCIRCHRVGGFGGNPHPSGWQSGRSTDAGMCRFCHVR